MECICPINGVDHQPDTLYCTSCDTLVMDNIMSANYLEITINVFKDIEIDSFSGDTSTFSNELCIYILE